MIVYVASYPRSGNLWIRSLISNQFKMLTTRIHGKAREAADLETWANLENILYGVVVQTEGPAKDLPLDGPKALKGRFVLYDFENGSHLSHKTLIPGFTDVFTDEVRQFLAADQEYYFIKTHFPPPSEIFTGEYFIHIIRHPGASLWSYYQFLHNHRGKNEVSLESIVRGEHGFGDWSDYHKKFNEFAPQANGRFFQIKFEDLARSESAICERSADFLDLPILDTEYRPFEHYQKHLPGIARSGTVTEWEKKFSSADFELLETRHGEMSRQLGYALPNG